MFKYLFRASALFQRPPIEIEKDSHFRPSPIRGNSAFPPILTHRKGGDSGKIFLPNVERRKYLPQRYYILFLSFQAFPSFAIRLSQNLDFSSPTMGQEEIVRRSSFGGDVSLRSAVGFD